MPDIILRPHGNLGNHLLQWIQAESLRLRVPGLRVSGHDIPAFGLTERRFIRPQPFVPQVRPQDSDLDLVAHLMQAGDLPMLRLRSMVLQSRYYADVDHFRARLVPTQRGPVETGGKGDLLINIRAAEVLSARHPDYGPAHLGFYQGVVANTGLRPVFMGQLGDNWYTALLRETFPKARFLPTQGVIGDFEAIRRARHIVVSVSTFSWVAAWLSRADSIHLPALGLFNPDQRPDVWMLPDDDARYRFYGFARRPWTASPEDQASLRDLEPAPVLSADDLAALRARADAARAQARQAQRAALIAWAARARPYAGIMRRLYTRPDHWFLPDPVPGSAR